jgi:hypothetical protein
MKVLNELQSVDIDSYWYEILYPRESSYVFGFITEERWVLVLKKDFKNLKKDGQITSKVFVCCNGGYHIYDK